MIRTESLTKRYGRGHALDGLDLVVEEGRVHGFLGPNGAGKSTTIRIRFGLARPTSGTATVLDADPWGDAARLHRRVASVSGDVSLWPNISRGEAIDLLSRLRGGGTGPHYATARRRLCDAFQLDTRTKGRAYSTRSARSMRASRVGSLVRPVRPERARRCSCDPSRPRSTGIPLSSRSPWASSWTATRIT